MGSWKPKANQEIKWKIQEVVIKNPQLNYHYNKPYTRGHLHSWRLGRELWFDNKGISTKEEVLCRKPVPNAAT